MSPTMQPEPPRVALVTGGTDGLGRAVAAQLAQAGDRVLITGRNPARGQQVLAELRRLNPEVEHAFLPADLSLLTETGRLVEDVGALTTRLDAVVCCAGVLCAVPHWTDEGLEHTLVLNYLSRFVLARGLLPMLSKSPSGRLVLVANAGKYRDTLDLDDLQHRQGRPGLAVSGRTQFANDLLAIELAERLRGTRVEVTCVYPGVVKTDLFSHAIGLPRLAGVVAPVLVSVLGQAPRAAARTPAWLARDAAAVGIGGSFYGPGCKRRRVPARARGPERRHALWSASEQVVTDHSANHP